jgi:uncharacterized protein (TIGR02453 family)
MIRSDYRVIRRKKVNLLKINKLGSRHCGILVKPGGRAIFACLWLRKGTNSCRLYEEEQEQWRFSERKRSMKVAFDGFSPGALTFLGQLKRHNRRPWFLKNKETYEQRVKTPMTQLVQAINAELRHFAPEMVTEPKRAIYRIYRDIRFSPDKSPYKTHVAALFAPTALAKHACAGYYFHFSPEELLVAGGVYMPGPRELLAIRNHIAENSKELRGIAANGQFKKLFCGLEGDQLSRVPKGFASDHPAVDLLRYKQFLVATTHPPDLVLRKELLPTLVQAFKAMTPLVRFLNAPLKPGKRELLL